MPTTRIMPRMRANVLKPRKLSITDFIPRNTNVPICRYIELPNNRIRI